MKSDDRSDLMLTRIRSMALIKFKKNQTCFEFFNTIKDQLDILPATKGGKIYEQNTIFIKNIIFDTSIFCNSD